MILDSDIFSSGGSSILRIQYDDRDTIRALTPKKHDCVLIEGIGLFSWVIGSLEPDDDETCFATLAGRWLLQTVSWDLLEAWKLPETEDALLNAPNAATSLKLI